VALVLGVDEVLEVRVVAAQHAHLRSAPGARGLDGLARPVEHAHVRDRTARPGMRALDLGAPRPDGGEVVADAAAAAHRLRRLLQRGVDAGPAVDDLRDRVAHGLHEAVDERRLHLDAGRRADAPGRDEAGFHRLGEAAFPMRAPVLRLDRRESARDAPAHVVDRLLLALRVLLDQRLPADLLLGEGGNPGCRLAHDVLPSRSGAVITGAHDTAPLETIY